MRTLIVYYSLEGNTAHVAEQLARALGAETLRLEPVKEYPSGGMKKFLWGGKSAVMGEEPPLKPYAFEPGDWDCLIFGFPVWASNVTPPLRTFVKAHGAELADKRIAAYACQSGAGGEKAIGRLLSLLGRQSLAAELVLNDPKSKPDPRNETRIADFCARVRGE